MKSFPLAALQAFVAALNAITAISVRLSDYIVDDEIIALVMQEGADAVVVHLLPDGSHHVTLVGSPSWKLRTDTNQICLSVVRHWHDVRYPAVAAVNASVDCIREGHL